MNLKNFIMVFGGLVLALFVVFSWGCQQNQPTAPQEGENSNGGLRQYVLESCDQWANYCSGNYCVYNNLWGENAGPQCIYATSTTNWYVKSTQSGTGVKTYPNSSREMGGENVTIGSLSSCSSTMNVSVPSSGDFCTAWDIWAPGEVMIWINKYGAVGPWGSYVETATIGGVTWDVYKNGYPGFLTQSNTNSMTVNIKAILDYCVSKGWLSSSGVIEKIQGGFEITSTDGQERTFTMNSYSVSYSTGGGTTSTTTTAATTTTTTAATTSTTTTAGTTTTTAAGNCNCGTCRWFGADVPACCTQTTGWGWQDGGCNRTCVGCQTCIDAGQTCTNCTQCGGATTTTTTAATTTTTSATTTTTAATTSTTTTSATTTTTSGTGETCSPVDAAISAPFTQNGAGEYCWTATSCNYINSWNLEELTINGVDFTNKYAFGSNLPAKIDGKWYIHYVGNYSWSHFELR
jgi:hypothetical protein